MTSSSIQIKSFLTKKWFYTVWAFAVFTPLIYFPAPSVLAGHPWKVELALSLILVFAIGAFFLFRKDELNNFSIDSKIWRWIIAPLGVFILLSATSMWWANSTESVLHHTLIWAVYLIFFLFAGKLTTSHDSLRISLISLSLVIGAIAAQCIVEYVFSARIGEAFGFRFARYAEIHATVLPLFLSFVLRLNRKHLWYAVFLSAIVWLAILFSMSRGAFLSSVVGIGVFALLRLFTKTAFAEKKRLILATLGLIFIAFLVQFPLPNSDTQKSTTLTRLTTEHSTDANNSIAQNIRLLFVGVGLEMFRDNKLLGVGADNFGLEFNKYRAIFSADEKNKGVAGQQEALFPERAHNEYLQILTELGVAGGIIFLFFLIGIARLAFAELKNTRTARHNILTHAAIAGIAAFLFSSLFSSFSFRLMQNGMVFFFLLALLLRNYFAARPEKVNSVIPAPRLRIVLVGLCVVFCLSLVTLSICKATSQYFVYSAENQPDLGTAENFYKKAIALDPANASANYLFGLRLFSEGQYKESSLQLNKGIEKGLNTSVAYSLLASSQILSGDNRAAETTLKRTVEIFPYSTFAQVRYASVLKNENQDEEAQKHFQIAEKLNSRQAKIWQSFINDGALAADKVAFSGKDPMSLEDLSPAQAVPFILHEREVLHPEEIIRFSFNK